MYTCNRLIVKRAFSALLEISCKHYGRSKNRRVFVSCGSERVCGRIPDAATDGLHTLAAVLSNEDRADDLVARETHLLDAALYVVGEILSHGRTLFGLILLSLEEGLQNALQGLFHGAHVETSLLIRRHAICILQLDGYRWLVGLIRPLAPGNAGSPVHGHAPVAMGTAQLTRRRGFEARHSPVSLAELGPRMLGTVFR